MDCLGFRVLNLVSPLPHRPDVAVVEAGMLFRFLGEVKGSARLNVIQLPHNTVVRAVHIRLPLASYVSAEVRQGAMEEGFDAGG